MGNKWSFITTNNSNNQLFWCILFNHYWRITQRNFKQHIRAPNGFFLIQIQFKIIVIINPLKQKRSQSNFTILHAAWGKFIEFDLIYTKNNENEALPISVPTGDKWFDPSGVSKFNIYHMHINTCSHQFFFFNIPLMFTNRREIRNYNILDN